MFRFFSEKLTQYSNNLVDWSRVGELLRSNGHRYTYEELRVRASIIVFTAVSAFIGGYFNDEKKTQCADSTLAIASGCFGFVTAHTVAILPLIYKRYNIKNNCKKLVEEIHAKLNSMDKKSTAEYHELYRSINSVINDILILSLADDKHARASQTWGHRRSLLSQIKKSLDQRYEDVIAFWVVDDNKAMINKLSLQQLDAAGKIEKQSSFRLKKNN